MFWNNIARMSYKREVVAKGRNWPEDFCTACGDELEDFCFSGEANDIESVRRMFAQCKHKHKFSGGFCSKLFIAAPMVPDDLGNPDEGEGL